MARLRSPNFPGVPLAEAIKAAGEIFNKSRHAVISRDVVAKDLGYSGLTGRSMKILGALHQYGLVENVAKGNMRVSQITADILHGYPQNVRTAALLKAGRSPSLFQDIYERFDNHVPSDNAVRSFLIQSGFTNEGAEKALKSFSETNRYLEIEGAFESYGDAVESGAESVPEATNQEAEPMEAATTHPKERKPTFFEAGPLDFNLSSSGLSITGKTTSATELTAFIEKLKALAVILPEVDGTTEH